MYKIFKQNIHSFGSNLNSLEKMQSSIKTIHFCKVSASREHLNIIFTGNVSSEMVFG